LLVYGLRIPAKEAVGVSLAAVGATSCVGCVHRYMLDEVELRTGLLFAMAGMLGAPLGAWMANLLPDHVLLLAFAGLMLVVATRLWRQASKTAPAEDHAEHSKGEALVGSACRRDHSGGLILNTRCGVLLSIVGVATGILSGLFGVGGGFVIVPARVLSSEMPIHRAVGTSLMVIALIAVSGIAARIWAGQTISPVVTGLFIVGGVVGLFAGQRIGRRLSRPVLQKAFVVVILAAALFVIARNLSIQPLS
jgi:uncharacterized membrane protein YfcA